MAIPNRPLKVLIAEDNLLIAKITGTILTDLGYEVCAIAHTVAEAVTLVRLHKPDLAVIDFRLAGELGTDIPVQLGHIGNLGILYVSGDTRARLTNAIGHARLTKPFQAPDLKRSLELVAEMVTSGKASPPFPRGFKVLRTAATISLKEENEARSDMSRASPSMRRLAQRLIAHEIFRNKSSRKKSAGASRVVEKLRPEMAKLMGNGGFRALLSRSLVLASEEVPWLRAVSVEVDGSLEGLDELYTQLDPTEFSEGKVVLVAQLLGLLVALIGPGLTTRLVGEIWPQISLNNLGQRRDS